MTPAELKKKKAELRAKGINLRAYCREHDINYQAAKELLCGKAKGYRGKAHDAAVALGLKPAPPADQRLAA